MHYIKDLARKEHFYVTMSLGTAGCFRVTAQLHTPPAQPGHHQGVDMNTEEANCLLHSEMELNTNFSHLGRVSLSFVCFTPGHWSYFGSCHILLLTWFRSSEQKAAPSIHKGSSFRGFTMTLNILNLIKSMLKKLGVHTLRLPV